VRLRLAVGQSGFGGGGGGTGARQGRVLDVEALPSPTDVVVVDSVKQLTALSSAVTDGERAALTASPAVGGLMPFTFSRRGAVPPGTIR